MEWAARLALLADIREDRLGPGEEDGQDHPVLEAVMADCDRAVRRVLEEAHKESSRRDGEGRFFIPGPFRPVLFIRPKLFVLVPFVLNQTFCFSHFLDVRIVLGGVYVARRLRHFSSFFFFFLVFIPFGFCG